MYLIVKLIIHDCLTIVMLYIVLAYLMLFAAITNAACLNNASFYFSLICANAFYLHSLSLFMYFFLLIYIMHSAFNLFVFTNYMFTSLFFCFFFTIFYERAMTSPEK